MNYICAELLVATKIKETDIVSYFFKDYIFDKDASEYQLCIRANTSVGQLESRLTVPNSRNIRRFTENKKRELQTVKIFYDSVAANYFQKVPSISHSK